MPNVKSSNRQTPALARFSVTARPLIDIEPPYDDGPQVVVAVRTAALVDGALALSQPAISRGQPATEPPALRLVPIEADADDLDFDVVRTGRQGLPAPQPRALVLVRAILETLAGERPVLQLLPWVSEDVYADLEATICPGTPRSWAATVRRLIVTEPADGVAEVAAVIQRGIRSIAIALRLESLDGRWVVTALDLG